MYGNCARKCKLSSKVAVPLYIPMSKMYDCSSFSTSMSTLGNCQSFQILAISSECVVISHYGFNLHFPRVCFSEKAMAPHSSTLAWRIPWTEEPGRLQTMGLWRVGNDWATSLSLFSSMHWRRKWQSTPVFFPGESQGRGSLVGCCLWGRTESDMTKVT